MTGPIHIVLTFDDNFWAPAYAVARSICLSTRRRDLVFHLLVLLRARGLGLQDVRTLLESRHR